MRATPDNKGGVMPIQTAFVVQPFTLEGRRNRRLVPLPKREVQSEQQVVQKALSAGLETTVFVGLFATGGQSPLSASHGC